MSARTDFVVAKKRKSAPTRAHAERVPTKRRRSGGGESALQTRRRNTALSILSSFASSDSISSSSSSSTPAPSLSSKTSHKQKARVLDESSSSSTVDLTHANSQSKSSAAEPVPQRSRSTVNEWLGLVELARQTGLHSVTTVDPGTRNFALCRLEFYPSVRLTHFRVLDLSVLCQAMEAADDRLALRSAADTVDAQAFALGDYIRREALAPSGCFNSSIVLIEEQSFSRDMARIEECVRATVNSVLPLRTLNANNKIPSAQLFSSRSVKSCYRPFFPDVAPSLSYQTSQRRQAFAMGDSRRDSGAEQQRLFNKKNAIRYGQLILPQSELARVIPAANLTEFDRSRVLKSKSDDLYDTLFMALYFGSSHLHHYAKLIRANSSETLSAFVSPPQRPLNCWEEVIEFCKAVGTPRKDVEQLFAALVSFDADAKK